MSDQQTTQATEAPPSASEAMDNLVAGFEAELNAESGIEPTPEAAEPTPEATDAPEDEATETETDDAPVSEAASEENSEPDEDGPSSDPEDQDHAEDDQPEILAPAGMSETEQAVFAKLPSEMREWVTTREANRQTDYTQKTQAIAEKGKQLDENLEATLQRLTEYDQILQQYTDPQLSPPDPVLKETDPFEYEEQLSQYVHAKHNQELAAKEREQVAKEAQDIEARNRETWLQQQSQELVAAEPAFADEKQGAKLRADLKAYATKQGYDDQALSMISAKDSIILLKAMRYDAAMSAKKTTSQPKPKPPKAAQPGVSRVGRPTRAAAAVRNFDQNPGRDSLAAMFEAELAAER